MVNKTYQCLYRATCCIRTSYGSKSMKKGTNSKHEILPDNSEVNEQNIFDVPLRNLSPEIRKTMQTYIDDKAKYLNLEGNGKLPQVPGIGLCKQHTLANGKTVTLVYPSVKIHRKPLPMENLSLPNDSCLSDDQISASDDQISENLESTNPFKTRISRHQKRNKLYHSFIKGMPKISLECVNASEYYFENGLRKVRPYFVVQDDYLHNTIEPKTLSQYYAAFLGEQFSEYQKLRIKLGLVALNLENFSSTEQVIRKGDYISSIMHFHERPVLDEKIEVIYENNELLVVNKPASIVVYPMAGYRMNSLLFILAKEYGYMNLRPVHRIDKLTSGVMILSKDYKAASHLQKEFQSNKTKKEYVALVEGKFPDTDPAFGHLCNEPIECYKTNSTKIKSYNNARTSQTVFHKIREYRIDAGRISKQFTLLRCLPLEGRTHQIRIHLLQLGYPIVNDYLYNERDAMARSPMEPNVTRDAVKDIFKTYNFDPSQDDVTPIYEKVHRIKKRDIDSVSWTKYLTETFGTNVPFCLECKLGGYAGQRLEADIDPMFMCLHSYKYEIESMGLKFEATLPKWASDDDFVIEMLNQREWRINTQFIKNYPSVEESPETRNDSAA